MTERAVNEASLHGLLNHLVPVLVLDNLQLDLLVKGRYEVSAHGELLPVAEQSHVLQRLQSVALEVAKELLAHSPGNIALLLSVTQDAVDSLLKVSSICLIIATILTSLDTLRLHQHCLSLLLVTGVVRRQHGVLITLNHFDACLFKRLTHQDLQDGLNLEVEVKQVWIHVLNLDALVCALFIRNVNSRGRSIDVVIWLDLKLIDHPVVII